MKKIGVRVREIMEDMAQSGRLDRRVIAATLDIGEELRALVLAAG